MTRKQLEEAINRVFSSWNSPHKKVMDLKVGTGKGDMSFKMEEIDFAIQGDLEMDDRKHQFCESVEEALNSLNNEEKIDDFIE